MKNEDFKKMKKAMLIKLVLSIILSVVCSYLFCIFVIDGLFNNILANIVSKINPSLYYSLVYYKLGVLILFFIIIVSFTVCRFVSKLLNDMNTIFHSIDHILEEDSDLISLPTSYSKVEEKLNNIKYTYMKSKQEAKDAESKKNDLIVYMAHDLKTPLTSVIGYLSLLEDEKDISKESQQKYIEIALTKSKRLEDLINEFFEITRFNLQHITLNKQDLNLSLMLKQVADEFYPLLDQKQLHMDLQVPNDLYIYADGDNLARVFDNLLKNAVHYSYEQTNIVISAIKQDSSIEIHFQNTGDLIPEHQIHQIFKKFYRLDSARASRTGGAGLGLAIAKQIIELHDGSISVTSSKEYTDFIIILPMT